MEINPDDYDIDEIKSELKDYYGTAKESFPFAEADLVSLENKSDEEILVEAIRIGININNYLKGRLR